MMRILYFTNKEKLADDSISGFLQQQGHEVVKWAQRIDLALIKKHGIDFIVSDRPQFLIRSDVLDYMPQRIVNLHPSLLPYNRGYHPNFWSFVEDTPKGNTIHFIDEDIDTGDILFQQIFEFGPDETLQSTYEQLRNGMIELFCTHWPDIERGRLNPIKQPEQGTLHFKADFDGLFERLPDGWNTRVGLLPGLFAGVLK